MNPEVKKLWVEALRSGKYRQGKNRLRLNENTMCCFGVLCDISGLGEWINRSGYKSGAGDINRLRPTDAVIKWAGWESGVIREVLIRGKLEDLTWHNDTDRTFEEIAAAIEEQL